MWARLTLPLPLWWQEMACGAEKCSLHSDSRGKPEGGFEGGVFSWGSAAYRLWIVLGCSNHSEAKRTPINIEIAQNCRNYILLDPTASVLVLVDNHDTLYPFILTEMAPSEVVGTVHLRGSARNWGKVGVYACQSFSCSITYGT